MIAMCRTPLSEPIPNVAEVPVSLDDLDSLRAAATRIKEISGGKVDTLIMSAGALRGRTVLSEANALDPWWDADAQPRARCLRRRLARAGRKSSGGPSWTPCR